MDNFGKKFNSNTFILILILLLVGCSSSANGKSEAQLDKSGNNDVSDSKDIDQTKENSEIEDEEYQSESTTDLDKSADKGSKKTTTTETSNPEDDLLNTYSSEEIEYARIWWQLGEMRQVDELNIKHIPAGTPINSDDETSANYPEGVIQLAGSRLVEGSVTYSGNGDGTINVYKVPLRWDGKYPAGKDFYEDIIENTELVQVDPTINEGIIELIKVQNIR
ncbi:hypothetical protein DYE48_15055 [Halobacillus trueperi]|uniref:Lipoprotein n=2 Tax=Halobacillus trueperi TaxID=156205 RepID=A0A3E0J5C4_9BACI|nr:hypothetical protein DYE48_15055 [Halobacillus trueperi]